MVIESALAYSELLLKLAGIKVSEGNTIALRSGYE